MTTDDPTGPDPMDTSTVDDPRAAEAAGMAEAGWQVNPRGGPPIAPPPTPEETAARHAEAARVAAAARAREDAEDAQAETVRNARLRARAEKIREQYARDSAGNAHDADGRVDETWDDLDEHQARSRQAAWAATLREAYKEELAAWTLADVEDTRARLALTQFIRQLAPGPNAGPYINAIVSGSVGAGKTTAAIAAGHAAVERGLWTRFVGHSRYLAMLQPSGSPDGMTRDQVRARYRKCDLLIVDDFGADFDVPGAAQKVKPVSEHALKETLELVSDRLQSGRATIITTNLTSEQVRGMFGDRIYSRIGQGAIGVRITGPDRRAPLSW